MVEAVTEFVSTPAGKRIVDAAAQALAPSERAWWLERGGIVLEAMLAVPGERPCPDCGGSGKTGKLGLSGNISVYPTPCKACHGTGVVSSDVPAIIEAVMSPITDEDVARAIEGGQFVQFYRLREGR